MPQPRGSYSAAGEGLRGILKICLPEEIIFSSLNDTLGWDPIGESFGKLGSRERWPIPWLEDDPSMWFPQFRASHVQADMQRARELGCPGMLGIHWRHRIVDPTATHFARAAWDKSLTSAENYRHCCGTQAVGGRAAELASTFEDADRNHTISSTSLGTYDRKGFAQINTITSDFNEGFLYDDSEPELTVLKKQRAAARKLTDLTSRASSPPRARPNRILLRPTTARRRACRSAAGSPPIRSKNWTG
jgi:hypothetical protein